MSPEEGAAVLERMRAELELEERIHGRPIRGEAAASVALRFRLRPTDYGGTELIVEESPERRFQPRVLLRCELGFELADGLVEALARRLAADDVNSQHLWVKTPNPRHREGE